MGVGREGEKRVHDSFVIGVRPPGFSGIIDVHQYVVAALLAECDLEPIAYGQGISHVALKHQEV